MGGTCWRKSNAVARLLKRRIMVYISFYRKWRPQNFDEIIGQKFTVRTLKNAISSGRLAHSYMFCGPRGTGKTSTARILAKAVNCAKGPAPEPCNACENCISITNGANIDIIEIDAASNNGVEHIRELREKAGYIPSKLKKKIYIVDEVHMLSTSAFNALLKVLEEPPQHIMFILATTEPHKVLPTIMSRCQRFDFFPISIGEIVKKLNRISETENIAIDEQALEIIAKYADGSLRDADGILEQLASFGQDKITIDDVTSLLGVVDYELLFEFTDVLAEKDIDKGLLFARRIFSGNQGLEVFVKEFLDHLYNLYIFKNYEKPQEIVDMTEQFKERYQSQAVRLKKEDLYDYIEIYSDLYKHMKNSDGAGTLFKATLIKVLRPQKGQAGESLPEESIEDEESLPEKSRENKVPGTEILAQGDRGSSGKTSLEDNWLKICNLLKKSKISVHAMFSEISGYRLDKDNLFFYLDEKKGWHKEQLSKKNNKDIVADAIKQVTGETYRISFLAGKKDSKHTFLSKGQDSSGGPEEVGMVKESETGPDEVFNYLMEKFEIKE